MRLTDSTMIRPICGGSRLAVTEPATAGRTAPAVILSAESNNVFPCGWLYEIATEDGPGVAACDALAVGFDNGFMCVNGHEHRNDVEYYTEEEMVGTLRAGFALAANARLM